MHYQCKHERLRKVAKMRKRLVLLLVNTLRIIIYSDINAVHYGCQSCLFTVKAVHVVLCRIRIVTLCQTADYLWSTNMFHANNSSCYSNQRKLLKTAEICTQNPQKPLITFMIRLFNILCEVLVVEKG